MSKIFDIDFRRGSLKENVSGNYVVPYSGAKLCQTDMGYATDMSTNPYGTLASPSKHYRYNDYSTINIGFNDFTYTTFVRFTQTDLRYVFRDNFLGPYLNTFNTLRVAITIGAISTVITSLAGSFQYGKWHVFHLVGIRNGYLKLYIDGIYQAQFNISSQVAFDMQHSTAIFLCSNINTGLQGLIGNLSVLRIYNHAFSQTEINKEVINLFNSKPIAIPKSNFTFSKPTDLSNETGLLAAYNMQVVNGNKILDSSGNGRHLTKRVGLNKLMTGDKYLKIAYESGAALFEASSYSWLPVDDFTFQWSGKLESLINGIYQYSMRGAAYGIDIYPYNSKYRLRVTNQAIVTDYLDSDYAPNIYSEYSIQIVRTGALIQMYINGVLQADTISTSGSLIYNQVLNIRYGYHKDLRIYNRALSTQEIQDYHNQQAKKVSFNEDFTFEPADGTNITPKGWIKGTGNFKAIELTSDDSVLLHLKKGIKMLECTTAGDISFLSTQAYSTWEFDLFRNLDTSNILIAFISRTKNYLTTYGYALAINSSERVGLIRLTNGVGTFINYSTINYISLNIYYRIKVIRNAANQFYIYIKGGNFGNSYQLVDMTGGLGTNPIIDSNYTNSKYSVVYVSHTSADKIGNIKFTEGIEV